MSTMRAPVFSRLWHCDRALRGLRLSGWHAELPLSCSRLLAVAPLPAELLPFGLQPAQLELQLLVARNGEAQLALQLQCSPQT